MGRFRKTDDTGPQPTAIYYAILLAIAVIACFASIPGVYSFLERWAQ